MSQEDGRLSDAERSVLDDRLALVSVMQEFTAAAMGLFDPERPVAEFLQTVAVRLGCRVALCVEATDEGALLLKGAAGLARSSLPIPLSDVSSPGELETHPLPYPEAALPGLKRWAIGLGGDTRRSLPPEWWLLLLFEQEPRPSGRFRRMMERVGQHVATALRHRRLYRRLQGRERALAVASSRLEALGHHLPAGLLAEDGEGRITHVNETFCRMFGIPAPPGALVGLDCAEAARGSEARFVESEGFPVRIEEILAAGEDVRGETLRLVDGRIFERDFIPFYVGDARVGSVWQYRDVTDAHWAAQEIRELNEELERRVTKRTAQLLQAEKMSALGRMTAGIAHELNNPLASVLGFGQLLHQRVASGDLPPADLLLADYLDPILTEAERARRVVRAFLRLSRRSEAKLEPLHLPGALEAVAEVRRRAFEVAGLRLSVEEVPDCWVRADEEMLHGTFLNIVNNARDAMKLQGHGTLHISARLDGEQVHVVLEDDGPGLPDPDQVFEPFYTTKPVGEGVGLGLALVQRFVAEMGGGISAENRAEGGARFEISLRLSPPREARDAEPTARRAGPAEAVAVAGRTILVVDDEEQLRVLQGRLLRRMDARVVVASSAAEARALLESEAVDAVVCDVKMPGESGPEFYRWLAGAHPELAERFLFVTGVVDADEVMAVTKGRTDLCLWKPFGVDEYAKRIQALFAGAGASVE